MIENSTKSLIKKIRFSYFSTWGCLDSYIPEEAKWNYLIRSDGLIRYSSYPRTGRKAMNNAIFQCSQIEIAHLFEQIETFLKNESIVSREIPCDGYGFELTIIYQTQEKIHISGHLGCSGISEPIIRFLKDHSELYHDC